MLGGGSPFDQLLFQLVIRSYGGWFEEQITDLSCKLWAQRANYVVEASLLRDDVSCSELRFDLRKPDFWVCRPRNGGSLMLTALMAGVLLRREPVAKGEAVEVVAVLEAEAVELVVIIIIIII